MKRPAKRPPRSAARERALTLLVQGRSDDDVARELGIGRATVWRWRTADPVFAGELLARQRELGDRVTSKMLALADDAAEVLRAVMLDPEAPPAVRVKAAAEVLTRCGVDGSDATTRRVQREVGAHIMLIHRHLDKTVPVRGERDAIVAALADAQRWAVEVLHCAGEQLSETRADRLADADERATGGARPVVVIQEAPEPARVAS